MNFTVPSDFNKDTIRKIVSLSNGYINHKVVEVYGDLPNYMCIGSGRGSIEIGKQIKNLEELAEYIKFLNDNGIEFNYTINAACTENLELVGDGQRKIIYEIDQLMDLGIKKFTVASVSLLKLLHFIYKEKIQLTLSAIANVNSVSRAVEAERLGATTIVLGEDMTRNIQRIKEICNHTEVNIEIIVNSMCNFNCIYRKSHYNALSHQHGDKNDDAVAFFTKQCMKKSLEYPVELIKSPWIRPEDLERYHGLGIDIFKIIGREIADSMKLDKMLYYYFEGNFDGNLLELNNGFSMKGRKKILNDRLDGFSNYFFNESFKCLDICNTGKCMHCHKYLKRAYEEE